MIRIYEKKQHRTLLAESTKYQILHEFESAILKIKTNQKEIIIGDFYGDPQDASISEDETFCVIVGKGIIIYYLRDPFEEFKYNLRSTQIKEIFRKKEDVYWFAKVEIVTSNMIKLVSESMDENNNGTYMLNLDPYRFEKLSESKL